MAGTADTTVAWRDAHVADLAGRSGGAGIELVIDDNPTADAG